MQSAASPPSASAAASAAQCWSKHSRGEAMERVDAKVLAKHWRWEKDKDALVWLTFDKQGESANTFSKEALNELASCLSEIRNISPRGLIIRSGKDSFIAGADIQEFANFKNAADAIAF